MSFTQAVYWAYDSASAGIWGKRFSWGLYTYEVKDAFDIASFFGVGATPVLDISPNLKQYSHFHTNGRKFNGYKHFHIWFGNLF